MTLVEIDASGTQLTRLQRWSHYLTILVCVLGLLYGLNIRQSLLEATIPYTNTQAGISLRYPANWLIDEDGDSYVFRVRDMTRIGFKTTIQISVEPVGAATSPQNVLNGLTLQRATQLAQYNTLSVESTDVFDFDNQISMTYFFTTSDVDAALEPIPTVVIGHDVLVVLRGQAIIVTFRSDAATFEQDSTIFDRFLGTLDLQ